MTQRGSVCETVSRFFFNHVDDSRDVHRPKTEMMHYNRHSGSDLNRRKLRKDLNPVQVKHLPLINRRFCGLELVQPMTNQDSIVIEPVTVRRVSLSTSDC